MLHVQVEPRLCHISEGAQDSQEDGAGEGRERRGRGERKGEEEASLSTSNPGDDFPTPEEKRDYVILAWR